MKMKIMARDGTWKVEGGRKIGTQSQPGLNEPLLQLTNGAQIQVGKQFLVTLPQLLIPTHRCAKRLNVTYCEEGLGVSQIILQVFSHSISLHTTVLARETLSPGSRAKYHPCVIV